MRCTRAVKQVRLVSLGIAALWVMINQRIRPKVSLISLRFLLGMYGTVIRMILCVCVIPILWHPLPNHIHGGILQLHRT